MLAWIAAINDGTADLKTFKRLARFSSEFKVDPSSATQANGGTVQDEDGDEGRDETVLRPGPIAHASANRKPSSSDLYNDQEGETLKSGVSIGTDAWLDNNLSLRSSRGW